MDQAAYILDSCRISRGRVLSGQELYFEDKADDPDLFADGLYRKTGADYPKFYKMDRLSKLGFLAAEILAGRAGLPAEAWGDMALVLSNEHASLHTDQKYAERSRIAPSPALFVYTLPNIVSGEICIRHGMKGENAFFITPGFDPDWMAEYVSILLAQSHVRHCMAGWVDVLNSHYDVFLYLAGKEATPGAQPHSAQQLAALYQSNDGTINA